MIETNSHISSPLNSFSIMGSTNPTSIDTKLSNYLDSVHDMLAVDQDSSLDWSRSYWAVAALKAINCDPAELQLWGSTFFKYHEILKDSNALPTWSDIVVAKVECAISNPSKVF